MRTQHRRSVLTRALSFLGVGILALLWITLGMALAASMLLWVFLAV